MSDNNPYQSPESQPGFDNTSFEKVEILALNQRIGRARYFAYSFVASGCLFLLLAIVGAIIGASMSHSPGSVTTALIVVYTLFLLISLFIGVVLGVRRLHDLGKSGWLWLLFLVPIVNLGMAIYLLFFPGTEGQNEYGLKPEPNTVGVWIAAIAVPVVMIIFIGILAAIAVPAYQDYVQRVEQARMQDE